MDELALSEDSTERVVKNSLILKYTFYGSMCTPVHGSQGKEINETLKIILAG